MLCSSSHCARQYLRQSYQFLNLLFFPLENSGSMNNIWEIFKVKINWSCHLVTFLISKISTGT